MVSQIYQLSFPLTAVLLVLAVVCSVVLFVCVRWCLRIFWAVVSIVSRLRSQAPDSKKELVEDVTRAKEE